MSNVCRRTSAWPPNRKQNAARVRKKRQNEPNRPPKPLPKPLPKPRPKRPAKLLPKRLARAALAARNRPTPRRGNRGATRARSPAMRSQRTHEPRVGERDRARAPEARIAAGGLEGETPAGVV